ncbi:MAG: hypothetical protein AAGB00_00360 [Planctomycetota bacterium]
MSQPTNIPPSSGPEGQPTPLGNTTPDKAGSDNPIDAAEVTIDRIDRLVSALVDEAISDAEISELERLLASEPEARQRYVQGMQLHADLITHYQPDSFDVTKAAISPVLGFLGPADSDVSLPPAKPADPS